MHMIDKIEFSCQQTNLGLVKNNSFQIFVLQSWKSTADVFEAAPILVYTLTKYFDALMCKGGKTVSPWEPKAHLLHQRSGSFWPVFLFQCLFLALISHMHKKHGHLVHSLCQPRRKLTLFRSTQVIR